MFVPDGLLKLGKPSRLLMHTYLITTGLVPGKNNMALTIVVTHFLAEKQWLRVEFSLHSVGNGGDFKRARGDVNLQ